MVDIDGILFSNSYKILLVYIFVHPFIDKNIEHP